MWSSIYNLDTLIFSDSTEISNNKRHCINCCYQLNEKSCRREGAILLIDLDDGSVLDKVQDIEGVLDCCWMNSNSFLGASAEGKVYQYAVNDESKMERVKVYDITSSLCLSVDWHGDRFAVSQSSGDVSVMVLDEVEPMWQSKLHGYEAWVCSLSRWEPSLLFSGGDDCKLVLTDIRGATIATKRFDAGVTSIQSSPVDPNIFSSGGYDEVLHVWDRRQLSRPVHCRQVGGGVWRHKWSACGRLALCAGMYGGLSLVDLKHDLENSVPPAVDGGHASDALMYGADWVSTDSTNCFRVAACSFYDHHWSCWDLRVV